MIVCNISEQDKPSPEERVVNIDSIPVYSVFKFLCSKYTGRIYLLTHENVELDMNFVPLDVEMENLDALPELLLHPSNLKLVQRFVREWNRYSTLTNTCNTQTEDGLNQLIINLQSDSFLSQVLHANCICEALKYNMV